MFATRAHRCLLLPPRPGYWFTSFVLVGPGTLYEIAVSAFRRSLLGRANTFHTHSSFLFTPRILLSLDLTSPYFSREGARVERVLHARHMYTVA